MPKFRKKPVVIEAIHYTGDNYSEVDSFAGSAFEWKTCSPPIGCIPTLEGTMNLVPGDWLIRGIKGELYPCKPDIFAATYEEVVE